MKIKFLVPVMAMIFAVGMSFANVERAGNPNSDFILVNDSFQPINEMNCPTGGADCQVQFEEGGPIYDVYDAQNPQSIKPGSGDVIELWNQ